MTAGGNSFKNATAHKVNSYYTLAISYCTFCVGKHTILGPAVFFTYLKRSDQPIKHENSSAALHCHMLYVYYCNNFVYCLQAETVLVRGRMI